MKTKTKTKTMFSSFLILFVTILSTSISYSSQSYAQKMIAPVNTMDTQSIIKKLKQVKLEYPVILVPGFGAIEQNYFSETEKMLNSYNIRNYTTQLPAYESSHVRATYLKKTIDRALKETKAKKVHLVAFSQGGVDSRYLFVDFPEYEDKVESLFTLSTPHLGTPIADFYDHFPDFLVVMTMNTIRLFSDPFGELNNRPIAALKQLTEVNMRAFSKKHPFPKKVPLFSLAAVSSKRHHNSCPEHTYYKIHQRSAYTASVLVNYYLIKHSHADGNRTNDGIVPLDSSHYGKFLGCVTSDHIMLSEHHRMPVGVKGDYAPPAKYFYASLMPLLEAVEKGQINSIPYERVPKWLQNRPK